MRALFEGKEKIPSISSKLDAFRSLIGGTISVFVLLLLGQFTHNLFIMTPFGATCVLLYAASQSPLAQPRNIIFGHLISAFIGLFLLKFFGISLFTMALSVDCSIALMQLLQCVHPPAGATPLLILLTGNHIHYGWDFLIFPVLLGSISLVIIAHIVNNIKTKQKWPLYGLGLIHSKKNE